MSALPTREKRKNSPRRHFPVWAILLLAGFGLGVVVTLLVVRPGSPETVPSDPPAGLYLTATAVVEGATRAAQPLLADDPVMATTTALLRSAPPGSDIQGDPLLATATAIIVQATQAAAGS